MHHRFQLPFFHSASYRIQRKRIKPIAQGVVRCKTPETFSLPAVSFRALLELFRSDKALPEIQQASKPTLYTDFFQRKLFIAWRNLNLSVCPILTMLFKLLFPGVVFHELAHYLACVLVGVRVYSVRLFDSREAFVQHASPNAWQSLAITLAPFLLNNLLGVWLVFFANDLLRELNFFALLPYWLSISLVFHSFPSSRDAMNSFDAARAACLRRLKRGSFLSRAAWLALTPVLFIPVLLLTGMLLVFDKSNLLKAAWVFLAVLFALQPQALISSINNIFI
jgi:hypothetical protein